jgi:uncharacterized membrane protein
MLPTVRFRTSIIYLKIKRRSTMEQYKWFAPYLFRISVLALLAPLCLVCIVLATLISNGAGAICAIAAVFLVILCVILMGTLVIDAHTEIEKWSRR